MFVETCSAVFAPLVSTYGFSGPEVEDFGREVFLHYHRADRSISVSRELGAAPIVEVFYLAAETGDPPSPWAERNGVSRARRVVKLPDSVLRLSFDDGSDLEARLRELFSALEQSESEFLSC